MDLNRLINRVFVFLCIYEERNEDESIVVEKVIRVADDIFSLAYRYQNKIKDDEYRRLMVCGETIKYLADKPFYSYNKQLVRKVVLDVTGDLARFRENIGEL